MKALRPLPIWAGLRAIDRWMIGKVRFYDKKDDHYNTRWVPDPGDLREVAERYVLDVHMRIKILDRILREQSLLPKPLDPNEGGFKRLDEIAISV